MGQEKELARVEDGVAQPLPPSGDAGRADWPQSTAGSCDSAGPSLDRGVRLEFVRRPDRLSTGYGQFADALTELEVGHVAGALVENAPRFGLRAYADGDGVTL